MLTLLGERMLGGEVAPDPYEADGRTPCDYCDYADVCGFDRKIPGSCPHRLEPLGKDEVWMRMERELEQEASDRSEEAQRKSTELSEESWRELEEALRSMHMEETDKAGEGE